MRDIAPFGLRMGGALRTAVERAAKVGRRSLNSEICLRLEKSLADQPVVLGDLVADDVPVYGATDENESVLLDRYRRLPPEKRRAVLEIIK